MPKQIYMGTDDFAKMRSNPDYLYVDKSLLVREFLLSKSDASLILRPRRFGKSLNLSMLYEFLSNRRGLARGLAVGSSNLFVDLKITSEDPAFCTTHQNKYPVIFISLKGLETLSLDDLLLAAKSMIAGLFAFYATELPIILQKAMTGGLDPIVIQQDFEALLRRTADVKLLEKSLGFLSECLELYYDQKVIILIDEYDAVLNFAWREYCKSKRIAHECGREMSGEEHEAWRNKITEINTFIRHFLGTALKGNTHLAKGLMTGIYPMAKRESASDLNNVQVYSLLDDEYSRFFGFLDIELDQVLKAVSSEVDSSELKSWYNGYQAGVRNPVSLYNPWSVLTCLCKSELHAYWEETGNHDLIRDQVLKVEDAQFKEAVAKLSQGAVVSCRLNPFINFEQEESGLESVMTTLFYTGYLTVEKPLVTSCYSYLLRAPNREIRDVYSYVIEEWLRQKFPPIRYEAFLVNLLLGNVERFASELNVFLLQSISVFEATVEAHYHMFMAGLLIALRNTCDMHFNNIESGYGRPDTLIIPVDLRCQRGLILEYKCVTEKLKDDDSLIESKLREKTLAGLGQINHNKYEAQVRKFSHIHEVLEISITFYKKQAAVASQSRALSAEDRLSSIELYLPNKPKEVLSAAAAINSDEEMAPPDSVVAFFGRKRSAQDAGLAASSRFTPK